MTALTIYPCTLASTTLATANQLLANVTGASNTTRLTKIGTSTGYGEATSQGTATAWAAAGSTSAPTGKGWLLDSALLEGSTILAGNWTPSCRGSISVGTATADVICRFYVRSSGGSYTLIGIQTLTAQAFSTVTAEYSLAAVSLALVNFGVGDKLYYDSWLNITANSTGSSGANLQWSMASSSTQGSAQISTVTPGYFVVGTASVQSNGTLSATAQVAVPATIVSNGTVAQNAAGVQASPTVQSNGVISESASINASGLTTVANAALGAAAQVATSATVQANAVVSVATQVATSAAMKSTTLLSETAQIAATSYALSSNSAISEVARIMAFAQILVSNTAMSAKGTVPGSVPQGSTGERAIPTGATTQPFVPMDTYPVGVSVITRPTGGTKTL